MAGVGLKFRNSGPGGCVEGERRVAEVVEAEARMAGRRSGGVPFLRPHVAAQRCALRPVNSSASGLASSPFSASPIPADLATRASQSTAEVRAIAADALPVLERARAVIEEAQAIERAVCENVHAVIGKGRDASDAAGTLAYALHTALLNLAGAADPDSVSAD